MEKLRQDLIRRRHNEWLKGHIGEIKRGHGNHRLRKLTTSALFAKLPVEDKMDGATRSAVSAAQQGGEGIARTW